MHRQTGIGVLGGQLNDWAHCCVFQAVPDNNHMICGFNVGADPYLLANFTLHSLSWRHFPNKLSAMAKSPLFLSIYQNTVKAVTH